LKANNTSIPIGKYLIGQTPIFKDENLSFFKVIKNGPTIIKLLALNHRIDYRSDREHLSKVASFIVFAMNRHKSLQLYVLLLAKLPCSKACGLW